MSAPSSCDLKINGQTLSRLNIHFMKNWSRLFHVDMILIFSLFVCCCFIFVHYLPLTRLRPCLSLFLFDKNSSGRLLTTKHLPYSRMANYSHDASLFRATGETCSSQRIGFKIIISRDGFGRPPPDDDDTIRINIYLSNAYQLLAWITSKKVPIANAFNWHKSTILPTLLLIAKMTYICYWISNRALL